MSDSKKLSTTRIAELASMDARQLFRLLQEKGWIRREENHWRLTPHGELEGGSYQHSDKYGDFIVWPETILQNPAIAGFEEEWISATRLAECHGLTPRIINCLLSELGWIDRDPHGWMITPRGRLVGGEQRNGKQGFFVMWPGSVSHNQELVSAIANVAGKSGGLSLDGHPVQNAGERKIDNWLYLHNIAHAYRRELPGSDLHCAFYLPARKIYIDYWGFDSSTGSLAEKLSREAFYREHGYHCIELRDEDLGQLDEVLPQKLLQFGLQVY